jgi:hypothetical protein
MQRIDEAKFSLNELNPLFSDEPEYCNNRLQIFINKVIVYTELKGKMQELETCSS